MLAISQEVKRREEVLSTIAEYGLIFASGGLFRQVIVLFPSEVYRASLHDIGYWHCPICLQKFVECASIKRLPDCGHTFHEQCIDLFLLLDSRCPFCFVNTRASFLFDRFLRSTPSLALSDSMGDGVFSSR